VVVKFVEPTVEMVELIASDMRQADAIEIWESSRVLPFAGLMRSWKASKLVAVVTIDDVPCVMMGLVVTDAISGAGVPWLLGTNEALKHKREFLKLVPSVIDEMFEVCAILYNYVHVKNRVSVVWLKRIGFKFDKAVPIGANKEMFYKFSLSRG
jgi:hypothetical protein